VLEGGAGSRTRKGCVWFANWMGLQGRELLLGLADQDDGILDVEHRGGGEVLDVVNTTLLNETAHENPVVTHPQNGRID